MKNLISFKAMTLFVSMLACSFTFSGCSDEEPNTVQAEVVFADDVNLTKIDQWESSMELEQLGTNIPFEIRSNSEWEIYFSCDDERYFCLTYPNEGVGDATVNLCVFNNSYDERCTGKMYIVFPKDLSKSHIIQLSQKGNLDNDENNNPLERRSGVKCPDCEGFVPISIVDLLNEDGVKCPHCSLYIPFDLIEKIKRQDIDALIDKLRNESKYNK